MRITAVVIECLEFFLSGIRQRMVHTCPCLLPFCTALLPKIESVLWRCRGDRVEIEPIFFCFEHIQRLLFRPAGVPSLVASGFIMLLKQSSCGASFIALEPKPGLELFADKLTGDPGVHQHPGGTESRRACTLPPLHASLSVSDHGGTLR